MHMGRGLGAKILLRLTTEIIYANYDLSPPFKYLEEQRSFCTHIFWNIETKDYDND